MKAEGRGQMRKDEAVEHVADVGRTCGRTPCFRAKRGLLKANHRFVMLYCLSSAFSFCPLPHCSTVLLLLTAHCTLPTAYAQFSQTAG